MSEPKTSEHHAVEFYSPGTFLAETRQLAMPSWDTKHAVELAPEIVERHGARPFGFRFLTVLVHEPVPDGRGGTMEVQSKTVAKSGIHYLGGEVLSYDDWLRAGEPENSVLMSNMRCNGYPYSIVNYNSYRHTSLFNEEDVVVDAKGVIVERGDSPERMAYRARKLEEWGRVDEAAV